MDRPSPSQRAVLEDHLDALRSVRAAGLLFLFLLIAALVLEIGFYCAVRFGDVLAGLPAPPTCRASTAPTALPPVAEPSARAQTWGQAIEVLAPVYRVVGLVAACLLALTYFIGMNVCLAGRLGGAGGTTSAFFWSVLLVGLLFPWQHLLATRGVWASGVFYGFAYLTYLQQVAAVRPTGLVDNVLQHARYLGYPGLTILIALLAGLRFGCGYRMARQQFDAAKSE